jgi:hypothetical protein
MISLESLFSGETSFETMKNVREKPIPPLKNYDPNFPEELEKIILHCLERDREKRYQRASELYRDLIKYINKHFPHFVPTDISNYLRQVFKDKIDAELKVRKALRDQEKSGNISSPYLDPQGIKSDPSARTTKSKTPFSSPRMSNSSISQSLPVAVQASPFDRLANFTVHITRRKSFKWLIILSLIGSAVFGALKWKRALRVVDPSNVPGLTARFEGNSAKAEAGRTVWTWTDSSPSKSDLTQSETKRQPFVLGDALNGHAALRFDGMDDFLTADAVAQRLRGAKEINVFAVVRASGYKNQYVISIQAINRSIDIFRFGFTAGSRLRLKTNRLEGTGYDQSETVEIEKFAIYSIVLKATEEWLYQNGHLKIQKNLPTPLDFSDANYFSLGQEWDDEGPTDFLNGDIAEFILFNEPLNPEVRMGIENYLGEKYDIPLRR